MISSMSKKTYLIFGISKGLGKALAKHLPSKDDLVYGISRTEPDYLKEFVNVNWIPADLSEPITLRTPTSFALLRE